jgi:hypothetical protein
MGMIVCLEFAPKVAQFFIQLPGFRFECSHPMFDFRMLMTVLFCGHDPTSQWRMKY